MKKTVFNGIDLINENRSLFEKKRLGLLSAASGVTKTGEATFELIKREFLLGALYSPEHGIRSNLQAGLWQENGIDSETGVPLFNVGVDDDKKLDAMLDGVDTIVYDIQDVGARFYTYIYNLTDMMRSAKRCKKEVIVLDRINPIGGERLEGVLLDEESCSSGIGKVAIPTRYAMTVGEYAQWLNATKDIGCDLKVVKLRGWTRELYADETDLLFVNPSPNIPSVDSAISYIGTCIFEATNVSEGRGTTKPFSLVGAPYVDSTALVESLRAKHLDGVVVRRAAFTPTFGKHKDEVCEGVELHITDRNSYLPLYASLCILEHMRLYDEYEESPSGLAIRYGNNDINSGLSAEALYERTLCPLEHFRKSREPFLLY